MKILLIFLSLFVFNCDIKAMEGFVNIIPGRSLGEINIGDASDQLKKQGFIIDESRLPLDYMKKGTILVRLQNNKVVQIWLTERNLKRLRFKGKKLPLKKDLNSFKKFFNNCEEFHGSGGRLLYCEQRGIELAFPGTEGSVGLSVILPSEVKGIVGSN